MNITPRVDSRKSSPTSSGKVKRPVTPPPRVPVRRGSQDHLISSAGYDLALRTSQKSRSLSPNFGSTATGNSEIDEHKSRATSVTFLTDDDQHQSSAEGEGSEIPHNSMIGDRGRGRKILRDTRCVYQYLLNTYSIFDL